MQNDTFAPPNTEKDLYAVKKWGIYGELGEGDNIKVRFVQTVLNPAELNTIKLVPNIRGSEKWDVRDLFQREIDEDRVLEGILPYFKSKDKVKFFNPLTLAILPMKDELTQIEDEIEKLSEYIEPLNGHDSLTFEKNNFYKLSLWNSKLVEESSFTQISWNPNKCHVVAIDGQHRLSGLKRWYDSSDQDSEILKWKIPVVLLIIDKIDPSLGKTSLLEVVRKTFVYINEKAERINECRKILLDDESINCLATQELVQDSHSNDILQYEERDNDKLPLIFFDWRGVEKNGKREKSMVAIKDIIEINKWFEHYLLGEDGKKEQRDALFLENISEKLKYQYGNDRKIISPEDLGIVREQIKDTIIDGFSYFLSNFKPYKTYIQECRKIEKDAIDAHSDIADHAFAKIRFGKVYNLSGNIKDEVDDRAKEFIHLLSDLKNKTFYSLLRKDIGARGIVYAYGILKDILDVEWKTTKSWLEYSTYITEYFDKLYKDNPVLFFDVWDLEEKEEYNLFKYIFFDRNGNIINYRHEDAVNGYGSLIVIALLSKLKNEFSDSFINENFSNFSSNLKTTIQKGYRAEYKALNKNDFPGPELNKRANKDSVVESDKRIIELQKYFDL